MDVDAHVVVAENRLRAAAATTTRRGRMACILTSSASDKRCRPLQRSGAVVDIALGGQRAQPARGLLRPPSVREPPPKSAAVPHGPGADPDASSRTDEPWSGPAVEAGLPVGASASDEIPSGLLRIDLLTPRG